MRVIVTGLVIVIVAAMITGVVVYFRRRRSKETALERGWATSGDLNSRQEQALIAQVASAATLFRQLLAPPTSLDGDITFLRHDHRTQVEAWLRHQVTSLATNTRKGINQS